MLKEREFHTHNVKAYLKNKAFHRIIIGIVTLLVAFVIIVDGASPKKYKLSLNEESKYDITAPWDIENTVKTRENREKAADEVPPVMVKDVKVSADILNNWVDFVLAVEKSRKKVSENVIQEGMDRDGRNGGEIKDAEKEEKIKQFDQTEADNIDAEFRKINVSLSNDQLLYLISDDKCGEFELENFKKILRGLIDSIVQDDITEDNLPNKIAAIEADIQSSTMTQDMKIIGSLLVRGLIRPNWVVDSAATGQKKDIAYKDERNREMIKKGTRILSQNEKVTEDKLKILEDLNLLETKSRFDFAFAGGIFTLILLLSFSLILYMRHFCRKVLYSRRDISVISIVMLLIIIVARGLYEISPQFSPMAVPICIAAMLISFLLDLKLAIIVNLILSIAVSFIIKGDLVFIYMSVISGSFSAYFVSKADQRSKISLAGPVIGIVNTLIIFCFGVINRGDWNTIMLQCVIVFVNGILSTMLTIGILPFMESIFDIITPLKLMELTNPNQPLLKRLLLEAPGTYHHSLMVGNLAEVATEAIGGNALLARAGAYFHDIGKLKRPHFFKENQMSENPHDKITANLSTLVITSHINDGVELAEKYKIPQVIKDIIKQHHGNTLVAYFYHKAKTGERGEEVKQENFRYQGPRPATKEAAVVMLADSVEAAVRSMADKTEGKIEGLIRKIIKDKLDDGQLDLCNLTLRDLESITQGFMRVMSGFFHGRESYPEIKAMDKNLKLSGKEGVSRLNGAAK